MDVVVAAAHTVEDLLDMERMVHMDSHLCTELPHHTVAVAADTVVAEGMHYFPFLIIILQQSRAKSSSDANHGCNLFAQYVDAVVVVAVDTTPPTKTLAKRIIGNEMDKETEARISDCFFYI